MLPSPLPSVATGPPPPASGGGSAPAAGPAPPGRTFADHLSGQRDRDQDPTDATALLAALFLLPAVAGTAVSAGGSGPAAPPPGTGVAGAPAPAVPGPASGVAQSQTPLISGWPATTEPTGGLQPPPAPGSSPVLTGVPDPGAVPDADPPAASTAPGTPPTSAPDPARSLPARDFRTTPAAGTVADPSHPGAPAVATAGSPNDATVAANRLPAEAGSETRDLRPDPVAAPPSTRTPDEAGRPRPRSAAPPPLTPAAGDDTAAPRDETRQPERRPVDPLPTAAAVSAPPPPPPPPPPAGGPPPAVDGAALTRQVADLAHEARRQMPRTVALVLHPEHLGRVSLRLSLAAEGLQAHLQVTDAAVKAALEANLGDLRQQLHSQGLHLTGLQVSVSGSGAGQTGDHPTDGWQPPTPQTPRHPPAAAPAPAPAVLAAASPPGTLVGRYLNRTA